MKNHVKQIVGLRRPVDYEMPLQLFYPFLHFHVPTKGYRFQYLLDLRNLTGRNIYGELGPIQNLTERQHVVIGDDDRHTAGGDGFHYSRAGDFPPARAEAEPAVGHRFGVAFVLREVLVDLDFVVVFFPGIEEEGTHVAGFAAGEEGEGAAEVRGFVEVGRTELAWVYVDFW